VRTVSALMSPDVVEDVTQPSPWKVTFTLPLLKGARIQRGTSHQLTPRRAHSRGISCRITPPDAPSPSAEPVIRPGRNTSVVPVMLNWIWEPLVTASRSRMKFVSWRVRPGFVEVERICDMRTGRPVSVARRRRVVRCLCPMNWTRAWWESSAAILGIVESVSVSHPETIFCRNFLVRISIRLELDPCSLYNRYAGPRFSMRAAVRKPNTIIFESCND
jgi:hypothetical protein